MQNDLFDNQEPDRAGSNQLHVHLTIQERFELFHQKHPDIYELFKRFVSELVRAGRSHYGAKMIMERIRWECAVSSSGNEDFKINNVFTSRYARMFIQDHPNFKGFFELRRLKSP